MSEDREESGSGNNNALWMAIIALVALIAYGHFFPGSDGGGEDSKPVVSSIQKVAKGAAQGYLKDLAEIAGEVAEMEPDDAAHWIGNKNLEAFAERWEPLNELIDEAREQEEDRPGAWKKAWKSIQKGYLEASR